MNQSRMDWYGMSDIAIVSELGKRIKATRLRKNFTQTEVAERAGISVFTVSQMENGKNTSLYSLVAVLRVLRLLENINDLVPEVAVSPVELLKNNKKKRIRARK